MLDNRPPSAQHDGAAPPKVAHAEVSSLGDRDFPAQLGRVRSSAGVGGYYVDFTPKAPTPHVSPEVLHASRLHVVACQWGLGCYDRYLRGEGDVWLAAAITVGSHLVATQETTGPLVGAWRHAHPRAHTYSLPSGWISAMAQGEAASLLVRLFKETADVRFAEAAALALQPMEVHVIDGGVRRELGDGPFVEEYPTEPASFVLNGAIFAIWGYWDVALGLGQSSASRAFGELTRTLASHLELWDLGYWSRYDLYPFRAVNVAAPWYHRLHVLQLDVLAEMTAAQEIAAVRDRWRRYQHMALSRSRALARKVLFRIVVPRRVPRDPSEPGGMAGR